MILNPIILALVFAFLARGAGGVDVNNNETTTNSSQGGTSTPDLENNNNVADKCKKYAKLCQDCSSIVPTTKYKTQKASYSTDGRITMATGGTKQESSGTQSTKLITTTNYTTQKPSTVQTDTSGTTSGTQSTKLTTTINYTTQKPSTTPPYTPGTTRSNNGHTYNCHNSPQHDNLGHLALCFALTVVSLLLVGFVVYHWCTVIRRPRWNQDNEAVIANSDVASNSFAMRLPSTNISQEQLNEGITLERLEHENLVEFEWMCMRLDNGQRRDYERLAAKYPRISLDQRQSLQNEFQNRGGSPSKALMKHLQVLYPYLTLGDLLRSLAEIGRVDIVQRLSRNVKKDTCGTVA